MKRLFVKRTDETVKTGIADHQIVHIEGKQWDGDVLVLSVIVRDLDGGPAGPYKVANADTEEREVDKAVKA